MDQASANTYEGRTLSDRRLTLLGDGAQKQDLLGYQPYVNAMVEVLAQKDLQTPFAVGVFGRWGTGKSTFMKLLNRQLSRPERKKENLSGGFHTVLFQPWQFEEKEEVWKALLLSVIRYLEVVEQNRETRGEVEARRIRETLSALALSVGKLALNKTIQTMTADSLNLDSVLTAYAKTARENSQFINTFRDKFGKLKNEILKDDEGDSARLFIFVDDLDRCNPDNCIVVLEAIKLFFDLRECVFIIGIDREVVQRGIQEKYKNSIGIHGQDYIDKLIQLPFSLPPIRAKTFETFVKSITVDFGFNEQTRALIVKAADSNPRRAKRLSNCLQLARMVADRVIDETPEIVQPIDYAKLALLLTLQVRYPVAYLWLSQNPMTLADLGAGWSDDHRPKLVYFLEKAYGDEIGGKTADDFYDLWRYAYEHIKVEPFGDASELQAYMRIAGVVEEDRAQRYVKNQTETADESLDQNFVGAEDWDAPEVERPRTPPVDTADREKQAEADAARAELLLGEARRTLTQWENFEDINVLRASYALPNLLRRAQKISEKAEGLAGRIDSFFFGTKGFPDLDDALGELRNVSPERAFRHVAAVAGSFALLWPFAIFALGTGLELLLGAAASEYDRKAGGPELISSLEQFAYSLIGKNSLGNLSDTIISGNLWQGATMVPDVFPGGQLFFWAAMIYSPIAIGVRVRALSRLRRIRREIALTPPQDPVGQG